MHVPDIYHEHRKFDTEFAQELEFRSKGRMFMLGVLSHSPLLIRLVGAFDFYPSHEICTRIV